MGIYLGAEELSTGGAASAGSFPKRFIAGTGEITWPNNENIYPPAGTYPWTVPTEIKTVIDAGGSYPVRLIMVGGGSSTDSDGVGEVRDIIYDLTSSNYDSGSTTTISTFVGGVNGKSGISGGVPSPLTGSVTISNYLNDTSMTGLSVGLPSGVKLDSNGYPLIGSIQLWRIAGPLWSGNVRYIDYGGSGFTVTPTLGSTESVYTGGGLLSFANNANQPWDGTYTIRVQPTGNANAYATFEISYNLNTGNMDFTQTAAGSSITGSNYQRFDTTGSKPTSIVYENAMVPTVYAREGVSGGTSSTQQIIRATYPNYSNNRATGTEIDRGYGPHGFGKFTTRTAAQASRIPGTYLAQGYVEIQWF